jgi:hypothetical protein
MDRGHDAACKRVGIDEEEEEEEEKDVLASNAPLCQQPP